MLTVRGFFISPARSTSHSEGQRRHERASDGRSSECGTRGQTAAAQPGLPPFRYGAGSPSEIELRWQDHWAAAGTFRLPQPVRPAGRRVRALASRPKCYVLDMFPYASGIGIHVGHPEGYIATDVYARYLRMTGHHVLHAMGFDAFGLPAEQYRAEQPASTRRSRPGRTWTTCGVSCGGWAWATTPGAASRPPIPRSTAGPSGSSCRSSTAGWTSGPGPPVPSTSWSPSTPRASGRCPAAVDGTDLTPAEQRELIDDHRLAYIAEEPVNWCPGLGTVLANEEVTADGRSDIGNFPVYRRPMRQWMMRITAMAQRLIDDLEPLAWPEHVKQLQRNWIGASDGAIIWLPMADPADGRVEVFTTRPDTLRGATYVVLAPEHPLVDSLVADAWPDGTPGRWRGRGIAAARCRSCLPGRCAHS